MATIAQLLLLLGPKEGFPAIVVGAVYPTPGTTSAHKRELHLSRGAIFLSEVGALKLRVAGRRRELVELKMVNAGSNADDGEEGDENGGEEHDG